MAFYDAPGTPLSQASGSSSSRSLPQLFGEPRYNSLITSHPTRAWKVSWQTAGTERQKDADEWHDEEEEAAAAPWKRRKQQHEVHDSPSPRPDQEASWKQRNQQHTLPDSPSPILDQDITPEQTRAHAQQWKSLQERLRRRQPIITRTAAVPQQNTVAETQWQLGGTCGRSWHTVMTALHQRLHHRHEAYVNTLQLQQRLLYSMDPMRGQHKNSGDMCMERIQHDLDRFGHPRSSLQKLFHYWFIQAVLEKVYGSEWDSSATRVLAQYGLREPHTEVMAMTPRRFGKTWSVAMFVVALALNKHGIRIAIFSTGKRASNSLMSIAKTFMGYIPGATERICKQTNEELYVAAKPLPPGRGPTSLEARRLQTDPTTSTIHGYPGSVTGMFSSLTRSFFLSFCERRRIMG